MNAGPWPGNRQPLPGNTLLDQMRWRGAHQPGRRAFTFLRDGDNDAIHITYEGLDRRARAVGALLQRHTRPGDRAVLLYPSGLDYITAFLGCLYAGVIAVPAYPPNPRLERTLRRFRAITADAEPAAFLTTSSIAPIAGPLTAREPGFAGIRWLATDTAADAEADVWREPVIDTDTLAFLQYTSGSTTVPRGVMVSHGNLMSNEALIKRVMEVNADSVAVSWLPMYHDMGLIGLVLQPIYAGFPCVLMSPGHFLADPVRWLRAISRYRATVSAAPNFAYDLCSAQITPDERAALDLSTWKVAVNGAEPVRQETLAGFIAAFGRCGLRPEVFAPCYGLAEATLLVSGGPVADLPLIVQAAKAELQRGRVTVTPATDTVRTSALVGSGQPQPEQPVVIVDPSTCRPRPPGEVGEIWVTGPGVAHGYWNSPDATEQTFRARLAGSGDGPFLRTGDLGFVHRGQLFVTSRLKDLIIIRGSNHAPQDIERTAEASHPALRPGCGIAFTIDAGADPQLVIVHEVKRQYLETDCDQVAAAIRKAVAEEHELDVHAVVLVRTGTVPKTSSGKLQRLACRDEFVRGTLRKIGESIRPAEPAFPESEEVEGAVVAALIDAGPSRRLPLLVTYLRRHLAAAAGVPIESVPAGQPFTSLGLDSLRMLQLKQRVETELGVTVPLDRFIDYPTAAALAAPVLDAFERKLNAAWAELAALTDEQAGVRLAQLTAKEAGR